MLILRIGGHSRTELPLQRNEVKQMLLVLKPDGDDDVEIKGVQRVDHRDVGAHCDAHRQRFG